MLAHPIGSRATVEVRAQTRRSLGDATFRSRSSRVVPRSEGGPPSTGAPWEDVRLEPPRWLEALRWRVGLPSIRPDRSGMLHGEGPGRIDRLDLLALVLILVLGMGLRAFRADQPFLFEPCVHNSIIRSDSVEPSVYLPELAYGK